ncbi:MAG TPA: M13 family metallopeptidase [Bryobacteraceae bacterium]|nr:M13 family metallopeptidase [Bryobacteraceae bacterium]
MRPTYSLLLFPLLFTVGAFAQSRSSAGFSIANMDMTANPCVDFYQYACGAWMANNPVPADQAAWGTFDVLADNNRTILRNILEKAAVKAPGRSAVEQKIGDFYASCMDESAIDKLGSAPLQSDFKRIDAMKSKSDIIAELIHLHPLGVNAFFAFASSPDSKNSTQQIAVADQAGLGLPDRDYYLRTDAKSVQLRDHYVAHIQKMLQLAGMSAAQASSGATAILAIETGLAKGSLDRIARRDPQQTYHKMTIAQFQALAPGIDWPKYFSGLATPSFTDLNVVAPDFFKALDAVVKTTPLADLKVYMRWHLIHNTAPLLSQAFVDENFHFYGTTLTGAKQLEPRWKRCVRATDSDLGFALGQKFVEQAFPPEAKMRVLGMVEEIEKMLGQDIQSLDWMTPVTKQQALIKLRAIANKIGYPDKWRDYSTVNIVRGDAVGNDERASEFEARREIEKIGKPVDRAEWGMTPPTVNAYYSPLENNINFPAGILQPPFFDNKIDAAVNFGAVGAVMGHEMTHGFDDQGRQYDADGNLRDWWTADDAKEFEKRADCFIKEYSAYAPVDDVHLNGKLTLGENTADNGGVRLAFMAMMQSLDAKPQPKIDGFTPQQRFFLGFGQIWCENMRPELSRLLAQTDPHSPGRYRVNGTLGNMPEFRQAFACHEGQPMVHAPACRVW